MARYGSWRPLASNWDSQPLMSRHDLVVLHTCVGSLGGTDAYFRQNGYSGTESHFGVGHNGDVWQWQDTSRQAEANYRGNHRIISIETADKGTGFPDWTGSDVPPWTDAQLKALVELVAWACKTHSIPCVLVPDSAPSRRGIGYHRQGIEPWRMPGGEQWSTARGKVCPGNRRIAQIPGLIERAKRLLGGDDDMPSADEVAAAVWRRADRNGFGSVVSAWQVLAATERRVADLQVEVSKLRGELAALQDDIRP